MRVPIGKEGMQNAKQKWSEVNVVAVLVNDA
jgi:hypothetical protein